MQNGYNLHKNLTNKALQNMNSQAKITEHINKSTTNEIQQANQIGLYPYYYRPIRRKLKQQYLKL